ncbi:conserved oligomeric Golgi complex subunit 7 [Contarinia nasturtii]|uniref:conserved oligomeric Golgi complex subunit 7 n=1 Tax=Contarinia nasturtii TaxID=265458 RepID=UPI0012D39785|nr:conserved oligomeric Golgi complex subunit 7 [Contarinia nasturtii]
MDIGALSEENFDAVDWINKTLKKTDDQQNKEAVVSSLVSKLQLYVQQVNSALEETSQQVLASMPRIMTDAQNLQAEACQLKAKMSEIQKDIFQVHQETSASMANLERLDSMKTKLQIAKEGLQESDGWGKLVTELEDLFEQNDVKKSCEKLKALQKSLIAQANLPGQAERESQLEGFKNRIEALASTAVVQCFTSGDIEQSKYYVEIFTNMDRLPQLIQYYLTVQKRILQQQWSETVELSQNSSSTSFLREFYDNLFQYYQKQQKWCIAVFGSTQSFTPILVIVELFTNLQPSRENTVISCLKRNDDKLTTLQDISTANIHFGRLFIDAFGSSAIDMEIVKKISAAIFDYFNTFIGQTASFEQQWLASHLSELILIHSTATESVRAIGNATNKIFGWMDDTLKRCQIITQNCGLPSIVIVLNDFLKIVLDKFKKAQQQLHASQCTEHDWNLIGTCVSLLEHIGDFRMKLGECEQRIVQSVQEKKIEIENGGQSIAYMCTNYKISGKRELNEFKKLIETSQVLSSFHRSGGIFSEIFDLIKPICEYIHDTSFAVIFTPIENQLKAVNLENDENMDLNGSELPDYSFAPQEFITVIGQYLLTLPQHLEPLLLTPSKQLKLALELCDERYARVETTNEASADILLSLLTDECCALYTERIKRIGELTAFGSKQLACDIEYLGSVLEELGHSLSTNLQQTITLLRAPADNYLAVSAGCEPRLVTAIRQMRKIISKD